MRLSRSEREEVISSYRQHNAIEGEWAKWRWQMKVIFCIPFFSTSNIVPPSPLGYFLTTPRFFYFPHELINYVLSIYNALLFIITVSFF